MSYFLSDLDFPTKEASLARWQTEPDTADEELTIWCLDDDVELLSGDDIWDVVYLVFGMFFGIWENVFHWFFFI